MQLPQNKRGHEVILARLTSSAACSLLLLRWAKSIPCHVFLFFASLHLDASSTSLLASSFIEQLWIVYGYNYKGHVWCNLGWRLGSGDSDSRSWRWWNTIPFYAIERFRWSVLLVAFFIRLFILLTSYLYQILNCSNFKCLSQKTPAGLLTVWFACIIGINQTLASIKKHSELWKILHGPILAGKKATRMQH